MFSSLPSASKLYVCSTSKNKQKNAGISQRKKRVRKSKLVAVRVGNSTEADTLIGSETDPDIRDSNVSYENCDSESLKSNRIVRFSENTVTYCEDLHSSEGESSTSTNIADESAFPVQLSSESVQDEEHIKSNECVSEKITVEEYLNKKFGVIEENVADAKKSEEINIPCPQEWDIPSRSSECDPIRSSPKQVAATNDSFENTSAEQPSEYFSCDSFGIDLVTVQEHFPEVPATKLENENGIGSICGTCAENVHDPNVGDGVHGDEMSSLGECPSLASMSESNPVFGNDLIKPSISNSPETRGSNFSLESVDHGIESSVMNSVSSLNDCVADLEKNMPCESVTPDKSSAACASQIKRDPEEVGSEQDHMMEFDKQLDDSFNDKSGVELDQSNFDCLQTVCEVEIDSSTSPIKNSTESTKACNQSSSTYNSIASNFSISEKSLQKYPELRGSSSSLRTLPDVRAKVSALSRTNSLPEDCFKLGRSIDLLTPPESVESNSSLLNSNYTVAMSTPLRKANENDQNGYSCLSESDDSVNVPEPPHSYISSIENISTISSTVSSSMLPPVTVKEARLRSYVVGNIRASGSLLGVEELVRYFPDKKVNIFVGTWNMNGLEPPNRIDDFLLPLGMTHLPDIYAVGVQESYQSRNEWEILLQSTIGPSHVLFTSASVGVLHLAIFLRRDLVWFCSEPEDASVTTRPGSMVKTKGAVAISFVFFGTSFLFINSHLTAHERKLKERLADYEKICSMIDLPKSVPLKPQYQSKDVTARFDNVFWCGDLNFRVVQDRPLVLQFVENKLKEMIPTCDFLLQHDQLYQAMNGGAAFHGFEEGVIDFVPSYKFDIGTSSFESSKLRVPSYTDRVLYRCKQKGSVLCTHYNSVSDILTSDHKPVYATFEVRVKPGRDNIPLAAGLFKREVYLEAIRKRSMALEITSNHGSSRICAIM